VAQEPYPSGSPQRRDDDLQFDTAEPAGAAAPYPGTGGASGYPGTGSAGGATSGYPGAGAPGATSAVSCVGCGRPITDVYYAAGDRVVCPQCRDGYVASLSRGWARPRCSARARHSSVP
jgi:hypothetical protein